MPPRRGEQNTHKTAHIYMFMFKYNAEYIRKNTPTTHQYNRTD